MLEEWRDGGGEGGGFFFFFGGGGGDEKVVEMERREEVRERGEERLDVHLCSHRHDDALFQQQSHDVDLACFSSPKQCCICIL